MLQVEEFVLLGHSLGGYLATSYTIRHPHRVRHLVLVDPWGFAEPPSKEDLMATFPRFQRLTWQVLSHLRPFSAVRVAGPWGALEREREREREREIHCFFLLQGQIW